jgi:uncharacterized protein (TIGR02145 family)
MKRVIALSIIGISILYSCSKGKDNPTPEVSPTKVTIIDTVKIGTQIWTSVNYNGVGGVNYNNQPNNPNYGKLYTIAEANTLILPIGWRIPTTDDYNKLLAYLGATSTDANGYYQPSQATTLKLMSTTDWTLASGVNSSGFNAFPGGYYNQANTPNQDVLEGSAVAFITASYLASNIGMHANFYIYEIQQSSTLLIDAVFSNQVTGSNDRGSLRFVKDN